MFKLGPSPSKPLPDAKKTLPWVEKYRPNTIDDIVYQDEVVRVLKKSLESENLPHLLFYGPPGTGKTSTILAIAKQIYGSHMKQRVLELNASGDYRIASVRTKVKNFSQLSVGNSNSGLPKYKLIILDEADAMTQDAQAALRRIIEEHTNNTRFCLICNYISRIIEPLTSRCAKFRFKSLENDVMRDRLLWISNEENQKLDEDAVNAVMQCSNGDLRRGITLVQSVSQLYGTVTAESVKEIAGVIPDDIVQKFLSACQSNSFEKLQQIITDIVADAYSAIQLLKQFHDVILETDISDERKSVIIEKLAECDLCMIEGADEFLQLLDVGSWVMQKLM